MFGWNVALLQSFFWVFIWRGGITLLGLQFQLKEVTNKRSCFLEMCLEVDSHFFNEFTLSRTGWSTWKSLQCVSST